MDFLRIFDILTFRQKRYPARQTLAHKSTQNSQWQRFDIETCMEAIDAYSHAMQQELGLQKGDKVAIYVAHSITQWLWVDMAAQQIGCVSVPIHSNCNVDDLQYILNDAQVKCCFVAGEIQLENLLAVRAQASHLKHIILIENIANSEQLPNWIQPPTPSDMSPNALTSIKASIQPTDLATIIYTSGTTGKPKGVMLSHHNIVSNVKSVLLLIPINYQHTVMSFLPLSHVFERTTLYTYLAAGSSIHFADPMHILEAVREIRPHYFSAVPRFLEKTYNIILAKAEKQPLLIRKIVHWSISLGERYDERKTYDISYRLRHLVANVLVYRLWRRALGGRVRGVAVGAAALQPHIGRLFSAAGIKIREGYGLTETSPVIAFNRFEPGGNRFGTVGIPLPAIEVRIANPNEHGEGEIVVKGPSVMMGYYQLPEATAAVLEADGWLHTGDIGRIIHKRFLQITDRKKDIFKTTHGKYVAPQVIENTLLQSPLIEQCMIVGANRPYLVALIVPDFERLERWCKSNNIHWTGPQYMVINPKVEKMMLQLVSDISNDLANIEKVRKVILLFQPWEVETGELTHTLKIKRATIEQKYALEIEAIYKS